MYARMVFVFLNNSLYWIVNIWNITKQIFLKFFDYITKKSIKFFSNLNARGNDVIVVNQRYVFIGSHFFREKRLNYFPKFVIIINVLYVKIAIMRFFRISNELNATVTLLIICFFISFRSKTKIYFSTLT